MTPCACPGFRATAAAIFAALFWPCALRAEEPFDYFRNSWNVIGLKDYQDAARIDPQNNLLLADKQELQLRFGRRLTRLSGRQVKTLMHGWMPIVLLQANDGPVRYDFTLWATPLPTVKDWRKAFDWPTEGENFLNWIVVKAANTGDSPAEARLTAERIGPAPARRRAFSWTLAPGAVEEVVLRESYAAMDDPAALDSEDPKLWLDRTVEFWRGLMMGAARIETPCRKANEALLAAHVCQMIANDHGEMHAGEGFYDKFYIRDAAYQAMQLQEAGLWDAAARAVECYLGVQLPDGRFETQKGQLDANGQAPWALWQYYRITADRTWLERVYPQMRRAIDWTKEARRRAPADSPFAGVLPAAVADGEYLWDGKHHILGYDFWNLRALLCTVEAARELGRNQEADELAAEANDYRAAIDAAWKKTGLAHFPPSWEKEGTHWGNTETLWPTPIFDQNDPRVRALIDEVRLRHGGGYAEGVILWLGRPDAIHPYMGAYTTMASMRLGDHEQAVEDFYWYLLHSSASHAFPEGVYFKRRNAWNNTIPHALGAANYALLLRHMLIDERGGELHLLSAVPDGWLAEGEQIRVERAPTHFGELNLVVRGEAGGVRVEFDPPKRVPPARIVLHLPKSRPLVGAVSNVQVVIRSDQERRWDFPGVVGLYRQQAPVGAAAIPGLIPPPLEIDPPADRCEPLDLTPWANTDPFTAPFGVANPGKLLFTGLKVGRQLVGGVPFDIMDPARNHGRGLIVLHSPKAPRPESFPPEVKIPVGRKGQRLYFLGAVHGWSAGDEGAGEWAAIGEYVICYADGAKQVIPLIPGRTTEEWVASPGLDEALDSLDGDPWHFNMLGVVLRPVVVENIIFRDLGTVSAPVLAAATLEH